DVGVYLEGPPVIALDGIQLSPVQYQPGDIIGQARRRDSTQSRIVRDRGLGDARRFLARFAHRAIGLGADDRRSRLLAVERRFHVIRADVVAVDRAHGALG